MGITDPTDTRLDKVILWVTASGAGSGGVDLSAATTVITYTDDSQSVYLPAADWTATWDEGSGPFVDPGVRVMIEVTLTGLSPRLATSTEFSIEIRPATGIAASGTSAVAMPTLYDIQAIAADGSVLARVLIYSDDEVDILWAVSQGCGELPSSLRYRTTSGGRPLSLSDSLTHSKPPQQHDESHSTTLPERGAKTQCLCKSLHLPPTVVRRNGAKAAVRAVDNFSLLSGADDLARGAGGRSFVPYRPQVRMLP